MKKFQENDQETGSWYLLEVLVKVSTSTPNPFCMGVFPPPHLRLSLDFFGAFLNEAVASNLKNRLHFFLQFKICDNMAESYTVKPVLSRHPWETPLCLLNTGCLF